MRFRSDSAMKNVSASKTAMLTMRAEDGRSIVASVESFGGSELVEGLRLARVPAEDTLRAVESLNARPDVEFAEPDYIWRKAATPNDPNFGSLYGMQRISAPAAWDRTTGSRGVVVAVLDGGVDLNHEDRSEDLSPTRPIPSQISERRDMILTRSLDLRFATTRCELS